MAERRKQQNFEKIYDYLPSAVWNALEAPNREKARASLLRHCWTLGLRCPSEGSFGMFATMLLMTDPSKPTFSAFQKYSLIAEIKKEFRKLKTVQRSDDFSYTEYPFRVTLRHYHQSISYQRFLMVLLGSFIYLGLGPICLPDL